MARRKSIARPFDTNQPNPNGPKAGTKLTRRQQHPARLKDPLLFIDTNILLDFYRAKNDHSFTLLQRIDDLIPQIITTYQVEMEFKKNRQTVILATMKDLKKLDTISPPSFLKESQTVQGIASRIDEVSKRLNKLRTRLTNALHNPTQKDPVYQTSQRLFTSTSPFILNRQNTDNYRRRNAVRRAAVKRFALGYPPRKQNDTSIGDAVNWEWIIECATPGKRDVVIVSRDSDYGVTIDRDSYINDWLLTEFRSRVSAQGKVQLTGRLSTALRWLSQPVTKEEVSGEETLIEERREEAKQDPITAFLYKWEPKRMNSDNPWKSVLQAWMDRINEDSEDSSSGTDDPDA